MVCVTALGLPGSLQQLLNELQTTLFREHGLVGARALPPLIPLSWAHYPGEASRDALPSSPDAERLIPAAPNRLPLLTPERYCVHGNALYLEYGPAEALKLLADAAEAAQSDAAQSDAAWAGACLAAREAAPESAEGVLLAFGPPEVLRAAANLLPAPPSQPLRQAWWQIIALESLSEHRLSSGPESPWWYALRYEVLAERRIAKARETTP